MFNRLACNWTRNYTILLMFRLLRTRATDGIMACVLIVDDNPLVRKAIRNHLTAAGVEICAEAVDGIDAWRRLQRYIQQS